MTQGTEKLFSVSGKISSVWPKILLYDIEIHRDEQI